MRKTLLSLTAMGVTFVASGADAQNLVLRTSVALDAFFYDQYDIRVEDSELGIAALRPTMSFVYDGQQYDSNLQFGAVYNEFIDSDFESTNTLNVGWTNSYAARTSTTVLGVNYSERLIEDYVELDDGIDLLGTDIVKTFDIAPSYSKALSEQTSVDFRYAFRETRFDSDGPLNDEKYNQHAATVGWLRSVSARSVFGLYANFIAYRPKGDANEDLETDVYGLSIGGEFDLGNGWSITGTAGATQVEYDAALVDSSGVEYSVDDGDSVFAADLSAEYAGQRNRVTLSANAGTSQQLDGAVDNQQGLGFGWSRDLTETVTSEFTWRYFQSDRNDREDHSVEAKLNWAAGQRWYYTLSYRYRDQASSDRLPLDGDSNRVALSIDYRFDDVDLSN